MAGLTRERAARDLERIALDGLDLASFWQASSEILMRTIPHDGGTCWYTLDPASLLVTSHYNVEMPELPHAYLAHEYGEDDYMKLADIAKLDQGVLTLHDATDGDPSRCVAFRMWAMPYGSEQMVATRLRAKTGVVWGIATLYRETGRAMFDEDDQAFLRQISTSLAEGARRGLLLGEANDPDGPEAPGLIVLDREWNVESITQDAERWLRELPDGNPDAGDLPSSVYAVAGRAMRSVVGGTAGEVAVARVLTRSGRWVVLHGASLVTNGQRRAAVIIEPAHPARITSLLMQAYGLSEREQAVTKLVLQGAATAEIASTLFISPHTVQEHLKAIFDKTGVRSRRDLVGKVFFSHYEPRLRDNETRALDGRPLRGGPVPAER